MDVDAAADECTTVLDEVSGAVIADREFLETVMTGLLAQGHVLLEDVPGTGKTLTARSIATALGLSFKRVQFTPDLLPTDVLGTNIFNEQERTFEFQKGPVFANVVLADEINRAPPKTQSALLEAMEEGQVTVDGETRQLPEPFFVIATQNPVEQEGSLHPEETLYMDGELWTAADALEYARSTGEVIHEGETTLYEAETTTTTLDDEGNLVQSECYVYETEYEGAIYTLQTETGRQIEVSGNHPFLVDRAGTLQWVEARNLQKEDSLAAPDELPVSETAFPDHETAISEAVAGTDWDLFDTDDGVEVVVNDQGEEDLCYNFADELTPAEAGFFVSLLFSDGHVGETAIEVTQPTYPEMLERWVSLAERLGFEPQIREHEGDRSATVEAAPVVEYLDARYDIRTPGRLVSAPEPFRAAFVESFTLAVGDYNADARRITITRSDREDTNLLAHMLLSLGIRPQMTNPDQGYRIQIQGEDIATYRERFWWPGETPASKSSSPANQITTGAEAGPEPEAMAGGYTTTDMIEASNSARHEIRQTSGHEGSPGAAVQSVAETSERRIEAFQESDIFLDRVSSIESEPYEGTVIGLSVPETHNYLAGLGGCGINHNTFPLPEAQMDRFMVKSSIGYPDGEGELELLRRRAGRTEQAPTVDRVLDPDRVDNLRAVPETVRVEEDLLSYMTAITRATRDDYRVDVGVSPRGTQRLFESSRARAVINGRDFVTPDDVKGVAQPALAHRLVLTPDATVENVEKRDVIEDVLDETPVPTVE